MRWGGDDGVCEKYLKEKKKISLDESKKKKKEIFFGSVPFRPHPSPSPIVRRNPHLSTWSFIKSGDSKGTFEVKTS